MEKLREIITMHSGWDKINVYIERIEGSREIDFSLALENAKALVESVCKEICVRHNNPLTPNSSMNGTLKNAFTVLGYTNSSMVTKISSALSTIGEEIGNLRSEIGIVSHGKPLEEIENRNNAVDLLTKDFLLDSIQTITIFLIRSFEERQQDQDTFEEYTPPVYEDFEAFNEFWDDAFGEFAMGAYSYPASQILYYVDNEAYDYERKQLEETEE